MWDFSKNLCIEFELFSYSPGKQQINGLEPEWSPCCLEPAYSFEEPDSPAAKLCLAGWLHGAEPGIASPLPRGFGQMHHGYCCRLGQTGWKNHCPSWLQEVLEHLKAGSWVNGHLQSPGRSLIPVQSKDVCNWNPTGQSNGLAFQFCITLDHLGDTQAL